MSDGNHMERPNEDPLKITMTDLAVLAGEVAAGKLTEDEAAPRVADLCTQHGPAAVQALDAYYEIELKRAMAR